MSEEFEPYSREELAVLGREYLLAGHLIDRAGMPHVIGAFGLEAMRDVAIDEWMGASPIYTRRIRRALGFDGDDVPTIFKGMQFDIGAPHEFMDFRYSVTDAKHGEFSLASCGALMDVEPMGEDFVVAMCHDIEDPTFDATAAATNPRARMRPVHRPPRVPSDREPHCRWTVGIDDAADPIPEPEAAVRLAAARAATIELSRGRSTDGDGARDYAGPFDPDLRLEHFSHDTLVLLLQEFALQGHLLARSFMLAVADRFGVEIAERMGTQQLTGIAGLTSRRLAKAIGAGPGLGGVARVLAVHPAFHPRAYVDVVVDHADAELIVTLRPCLGLEEGDDLSWPALLGRSDCGAVGAAVTAVDGAARVEPVAPPRSGAVASWRVTIGAAGVPAEVPVEVKLTEFSTGAEFDFRTH